MGLKRGDLIECKFVINAVPIAVHITGRYKCEVFCMKGNDYMVIIIQPHFVGPPNLNYYIIKDERPFIMKSSYGLNIFKSSF